MVLAAGTAGLCGQMPIHQQAADIVIRIPAAALVNAVGPFSQCHGRHTVVLRDYQIAFTAAVDQCKVHRVCSRSDHNNVTVIRGKDVICVAEQRHGDFPPLCGLLCQPHHRAGVRIHPDVHQRSSICTVSLFPFTATSAMLPQISGI